MAVTSRQSPIVLSHLRLQMASWRWREIQPREEGRGVSTPRALMSEQPVATSRASGSSDSDSQRQQRAAARRCAFLEQQCPDSPSPSAPGLRGEEEGDKPQHEPMRQANSWHITTPQAQWFAEPDPDKASTQCSPEREQGTGATSHSTSADERAQASRAADAGEHEDPDKITLEEKQRVRREVLARRRRRRNLGAEAVSPTSPAVAPPAEESLGRSPQLGCPDGDTPARPRVLEVSPFASPKKTPMSPQEHRCESQGSEGQMQIGRKESETQQAHSTGQNRGSIFLSSPEIANPPPTLAELFASSSLPSSLPSPGAVTHVSERGDAKDAQNKRAPKGNLVANAAITSVRTKSRNSLPPRARNPAVPLEETMNSPTSHQHTVCTPGHARKPLHNTRSVFDNSTTDTLNATHTLPDHRTHNDRPDEVHLQPVSRPIAEILQCKGSATEEIPSTQDQSFHSHECSEQELHQITRKTLPPGVLEGVHKNLFDILGNVQNYSTCDTISKPTSEERGWQAGAEKGSGTVIENSGTESDVAEPEMEKPRVLTLDVVGGDGLPFEDDRRIICQIRSGTVSVQLACLSCAISRVHA